MKTILRVIDSTSEWTGRVVRWLCVFLVVVFVYNSIASFVFNAPPIWTYETGCFLGAAFASLGWAYTHRHHGHVRIDILYNLFSTRGRAIIDVVLALLLFFPLTILLAKTAASWLLSSWSMNEKSWLSGIWWPSLVPLRAVIFLAFCLFIFQGVGEFIRDFYLSIRGRPL